MNKKTNPFPGMNPWLEEHWPGVHSLLISCLAMRLSNDLPDDLLARPEEGISISEPGKPDKFYRADVAVTESWKEGVAPSWTPGEHNEIDADLATRAATPTILKAAPMTERWIEIRDSSGTLITIIEILSPTNKSGARPEYLIKRAKLIMSPINVVEIDLLLSGIPIFPDIDAPLPKLEETHYFINVKRMDMPHQRELYRPLLRDPLPVIRIPLRPGEKDVLIDLQPLINQVHSAGRYHMLDYDRLPVSVSSESDQAWLKTCLG